MPSMRNFLRVDNLSGSSVRIGDVRVTPCAQAITIRWPGGGWVWNRPVAVLVERDGVLQRIPVVDVTRWLQIVLIGCVLFFVLFSRRVDS